MPRLPQSAWDEADRQGDYWETHFDEHLARYRDQFVAVKDERVVVTDPDLDTLVSLLRTRGLSPREVWIRYISEPRPWLLS